MSDVRKDKTKKTRKSVTPTVLLIMERTSSSAVPVSQAPSEVDGSEGFTDKQPLKIARRSLFASPQMEAVISDEVEYFDEPGFLSTSRSLRRSSRKSQLSSPPASVLASNPFSSPDIFARLSPLQSMRLEAMQTKKRSLSAMQSGETENKRPFKAQKVGQASVHEQSIQEGGLVNTVAPESNPTTRIVETLQNVMDLAATEHEAWKTNYRTTVRSTKQSNIASGPKETLVSSEPSTKPGPSLPTTIKKPPRTDQENQRLAALAAEDDGNPPIKPELKSEHPARPPPLPNNNNSALSTGTKTPFAKSTNPTTTMLISKISQMRTAIIASKSQHLTDVATIKQLKAEKITIIQDGRRELQLLKEEKNAEIARLKEEVKDLKGENRAVEKRCSMLRDSVFGGLLGEFVRLGRGAAEGKRKERKGMRGEEGNEERKGMRREGGERRRGRGTETERRRWRVKRGGDP